MHLKWKQGLKISTLLIIGTIIIYTAFANSTGTITNRTSTTSPGCNCHDPSPSNETTVSVVSSTGSFNVAPGSTTGFTITVANANTNEKAAGIDIAVKTTETGETDAGTLTQNASTGLKKNGKELVQFAPQALVGGSFDFKFTWKAPTTPGTYYLRAVGNAVNSDGDTLGYKDRWNWMPVQPIVVGTSGVQDVNNSGIYLKAFPIPATNYLDIEYSVDTPKFIDLSVYDDNGNLIKNFEDITVIAGTNYLKWNLSDNYNHILPTGIYNLVLKGNNFTKSFKILIVK